MNFAKRTALQWTRRRNCNALYTSVKYSSLYTPTKKTFYIETFGCQMNVNDSEIVCRILEDAGLSRVEGVELADVVLTNTCAVRENAEDKIWNRLKYFNSVKVKRARDQKILNPMTVGVLGDMVYLILVYFSLKDLTFLKTTMLML
jgi:hypothetical protein